MFIQSPSLPYQQEILRNVFAPISTLKSVDLITNVCFQSTLSKTRLPFKGGCLLVRSLPGRVVIPAMMQGNPGFAVSCLTKPNCCVLSGMLSCNVM